MMQTHDAVAGELLAGDEGRRQMCFVIVMCRSKSFHHQVSQAGRGAITSQLPSTCLCILPSPAPNHL